MEIVNKEMYHFHDIRISEYNDIWIPGNEIIVDDNYQSYFMKYLYDSMLAVPVIDGNYSTLSGVISYYLDNEMDMDKAKGLLIKARNILTNYNSLTRENVLEDIRIKQYPELPSRFHSIWLCDESSAQHWKETFDKCSKNTYKLYKISATGTLFKSSDAFLPKHFKNYNECMELAKSYWNPVFENEEQEQKAEYLFQGKIKVLEKIS